MLPNLIQTEVLLRLITEEMLLIVTFLQALVLGSLTVLIVKFDTHNLHLRKALRASPKKGRRRVRYTKPQRSVRDWGGLISG